MISTLQKLAGLGNDIGHTSSSSLTFNANLPVTIEVLRRIDAFRYQLRVGRKELTTKSQKQLIPGKRYWANFFEGKGNVLTISQLWPQPDFFNDASSFIRFSKEILFEQHCFSYTAFKRHIFQTMSSPELSKEDFFHYSYMLLAFSKEVVHLPWYIDDKKILLQFSSTEEGNLHYYIAHENLGPLGGMITSNELQIDVMYEKSLVYLQKEHEKLGIITRLGLNKEIEPLFDTSNLTFDIKG